METFSLSHQLSLDGDVGRLVSLCTSCNNEGKLLYIKMNSWNCG